MSMPGRPILAGTCLAIIALAASDARAQDDVSKYPTRPIHIIVGFAAGGGNDIIARVFGQKLSEDLGQPVIIENKPGGGAIVATEYVARSQPDGYTLLVGATGMAINQSIYAKLPYDSLRDFVAISELVSYPLILIVNASSPAKSVSEFVTYAKANADKMNYASASASFQLVTELFKQKTGAPMQAIPYKSANESVLAVVSGQVTTAIADAGPVSPQVKAGKVRALAVATPKRMEDFPDVPTMKEQGYNVEYYLWVGLFAPKGTPEAIVTQLRGIIGKAAHSDAFKTALTNLGQDLDYQDQAEFIKFWDEDAKRIEDAVKQIGRVEG